MEGVQVISREIVKPSSEIHPHQLKLSYLDQLAHLYFPIIFFFQATTTSNHVLISQKLKHTLSDTLTSFYPLAGRVKSEDSVVVDCNDAGVEFVIARNHAQQMMDVLKDPDVEDKLKQYIPMDPAKYCPHDSRRPLLFVQITFFSCGGIAIGMCFSHRISDLQSSVAFINCWARACKTGEPAAAAAAENPRFNLADYFPAREFSGPRISDSPNKCYRTKRLVFDKQIIAALKQYAISSPGSMVKDPSRVEVISAFMWKLLLDYSANTFGAVFHSVNLRRRKHLLENVYGNCLMLASAVADEGVQEFHHLVTKIRRSIRRLDDDYITEAQTGDNYMKDLFDVLSKRDAVGGCAFSSWCGLPLYGVDYGFGTPIWLGVTALHVKNAVVLISSKTGENIEAWINMEQHNFEMLRNQIDLISRQLPLPTI